MGYDANSLYLYCLGDAIPAAKYTMVKNEKPFDQSKIAKFSKNVSKRKVFVFTQFDTEVPHELYYKFS